VRRQRQVHLPELEDRDLRALLFGRPSSSEAIIVISTYGSNRRKVGRGDNYHSVRIWWKGKGAGKSMVVFSNLVMISGLKPM